MDGVADGGGIGRPVRRREDLRLLLGKGRYSDDLNLPNQAHAVMVRSPHAHARIHSIESALRSGRRAHWRCSPGTTFSPTASTRSRSWTAETRPI
jgi:hypothetical protein